VEALLATFAIPVAADKRNGQKQAKLKEEKYTKPFTQLLGNKIILLLIFLFVFNQNGAVDQERSQQQNHVM
jgi:hypothetical protein